MGKAISIHVIPAIWLLLFAGLALVLRWPSIHNPGFHNEDVAGITYNADLILRGYLPFVENLEYKAPGAFFASAWGWSIAGRSLITLQWMACWLSVIASMGLYVSAQQLFGVRAGVIAALGYTILSPITDSMDANYGAWMIAPYVWSFAFFVLGMKKAALRWLVLAGVFLACAGLMKRQAAVLFAVYASSIVLLPHLSTPDGWMLFKGKRRQAMGALMLGLVLGFAPLMIVYAYHGEFSAFARQYFFSDSGWKYMKGELTLVERLERVGDGLRGLWQYVASPMILASATLFLRFRADAAFSMRSFVIGTFLAMSFFGAALGLRFFKSYYLQVLPALLILSVHPNGLLACVSESRFRVVNPGSLKRIALILATMFFLAPAWVQDGYELAAIRRMRKSPRDSAARRIGEYIKQNTQKNELIWVWGRWGWPIYYYAERKAASHFPKSLGVFTTTLTNTWRRPTKNTRFDPDSPWKRLIHELKRDKPTYIVMVQNEDYSQFKAMKALLKTDYRPVSQLKLRGYAVHQRRANTSYK